MKLSQFIANLRTISSSDRDSLGLSKETLNGCQKAFDTFREDIKAVESAILKSTQTNGCSLELFEDTTYRILCDAEIGNSYKSPGIIISIPKLDCDDYCCGQPLFDNAIEEMDWLWETTIENKWEANRKP